MVKFLSGNNFVFDDIPLAKHYDPSKPQTYRIIVDLRKVLLLCLGIFFLINIYGSKNQYPSLQPKQTIIVDQCTPRPPFASNTYHDVHRSSISSPPPCLEFGSTFDAIVDSSNQVFILAPPKGSGSTLTHFSRVCQEGKFPNFRIDNMVDQIFMNATIPSIIVQHIFSPPVITHMMNTLPQDALIILVYREESKRKASGVKHIAQTRLCGNQTRTPQHFDLLISEVELYHEEDKCIIGNEEAFIQRVVQKRFDEVGGEMNHIMSCPFHEGLNKNFPNVVLVDYKHIDDVQVALGKKYCPDQMGEIPVEEQNVSKEKTSSAHIKIQQTGEIVPITDWVEEKRPFMDWALHWDGKQDEYVSCQSDTRFYENTLLTCKDKALRLSGL